MFCSFMPSLGFVKKLLLAHINTKQHMIKKNLLPFRNLISEKLAQGLQNFDDLFSVSVCL